MSELIHLEAYRRAIFLGSREKPEWRREDIEECERKMQHPAVRERIDEIGQRARDAADMRRVEVRRKAYLDPRFNPGGGPAA